MGKYKKYIKYVILFLILASCWAGNIYYYEETKIDSAIFFKNYKEAEITGEYDISNEKINYSDVNLRLYYIQNNDNNDICRVEFPEINSGEIYVDSVNVQTYGNFKTNYLDFSHSYTAFMGIIEKEYLHKDYFYVTRMNYWTKDGRKFVVNLGRIYFLNELNKKGTDEPYNQVMTGSTNDGTGQQTFKAIGDMSIAGMQSHIIDNVKKYVDVSIDSENIDKINFPLKIGKGKSFGVYYKLKDNREITSFFMKMNFIVRAGRMKSEMPVYIYNDSQISYLKPDYQTIKQLKHDGREAHEVSSR